MKEDKRTKQLVNQTISALSIMLDLTPFFAAIKVFYDRLIAKGKSKKVALVACMRKLVIIMNTMVKNNEPWHAEMV
jgi:transposase